MIEKNALFYMANFSPEIGRMFRALDSDKREIADAARDRALKVIDEVLASGIKPAGREEWSTIRSLLMGYDILDAFSRRILESFGQPFSIKFMDQYSAGMASIS